MHNFMAVIPSSHVMLIGGTNSSRYPDDWIVRILANSPGLIGDCKDDSASALGIDTGLEKLEGIDHITGVHCHFRRDLLPVALGEGVVLHLFAKDLRYFGRDVVFQVIGIFVHVSQDHFGIAVRSGPTQLPFVKGVPRPTDGLDNLRSLMSMITTETAKDIMQKNPIFAREDEDVEVVIKKMIGKNVKEIAVLDEEKRVVADVTMIDLLKFL